MKERIEHYKELVRASDPGAPEYLAKITEEAKAEGKLGEMGAAADFLLESAREGIDSLRADVELYTLHQQLGPLADAVNLSYIARTYFGKSRQWLYQRLKGQNVNGKPAAFKPQERATLINALNDVAARISDFTALAGYARG